MDIVHHALIHHVPVLAPVRVLVPVVVERDVVLRTFIRLILNLITLRKSNRYPIYLLDDCHYDII